MTFAKAQCVSACGWTAREPGLYVASGMCLALERLRRSYEKEAIRNSVIALFMQVLCDKACLTADPLLIALSVRFTDEAASIVTINTAMATCDHE